MSTLPRHRFVFVYPFVPGEIEARVHGHDLVRALGFETEALVLPVLPGSPSEKPEILVREGLRVTIAPDVASLRDYLAEKAPTSVFIDCLFGFGEPTHRGRYVLPAIVAAGGVYCVVSGGALPLGSAPPTRSRFKRQMTLAANPARLGDFIGRKVGGLLGTTPETPLPARVFSGHSEGLGGYLARTALSHSAVTSVNSFDYDAFLGYLRARRGQLPDREPIAVFLDENAACAMDFSLLADSSMAMNPDDYAASLRRLFDAVEAHTRLRVVIAAHPRADYAARLGFFGEREVVSGQSVDLVARSSMVLAHASTAVSFAALADKPLMMVKTASMLTSSYGATVDRIAKGLAIEPICSDEPGVLDAIDWDFANWSRAGYSAYLERYVCSHDAPADKTTWEIVARTLQEEGYLAPRSR